MGLLDNLRDEIKRKAKRINEVEREESAAREDEENERKKISYIRQEIQNGVESPEDFDEAIKGVKQETQELETIWSNIESLEEKSLKINQSIEQNNFDSVSSEALESLAQEEEEESNVLDVFEREVNELHDEIDGVLSLLEDSSLTVDEEQRNDLRESRNKVRGIRNELNELEQDDELSISRRDIVKVGSAAAATALTPKFVKLFDVGEDGQVDSNVPEEYRGENYVPETEGKTKPEQYKFLRDSSSLDITGNGRRDKLQGGEEVEILGKTIQDVGNRYPDWSEWDYALRVSVKNKSGKTLNWRLILEPSYAGYNYIKGPSISTGAGIITYESKGLKHGQNSEKTVTVFMIKEEAENPKVDLNLTYRLQGEESYREKSLSVNFES